MSFLFSPPFLFMLLFVQVADTSTIDKLMGKKGSRKDSSSSSSTQPHSPITSRLPPSSSSSQPRGMDIVSFESTTPARLSLVEETNDVGVMDMPGAVSEVSLSFHVLVPTCLNLDGQIDLCLPF